MGRYRARYDAKKNKLIIEDLSRRDQQLKLNWRNNVVNRESRKKLKKAENRALFKKLHPVKDTQDQRVDISEPTGDIQHINYGGRPDYKPGERFNPDTNKIEKVKGRTLSQEQVQELRDKLKKRYDKIPEELKKAPSMAPQSNVYKGHLRERHFNPNLVITSTMTLSNISVATTKSAVQMQTGLSTLQEDDAEHYKLPTEDLMDTNEVKNFGKDSRGYEFSINELLMNNLPKGMTREQFLYVLKTYDRTISESFNRAIKNRNLDYPDGLKLAKYSSKQKAVMEDLSRSALVAYGSNRYENYTKTAFLDNIEASGEFTAEDARALKTSRDILRILFHPGNDRQTVNHNKQVARLMRGKNLDRDNMTPEEFADQRDRQFAQVFNERMEELVKIDYEKFARLSDAELVANWQEYSGVFDAICVIKAESAKYMNGRNKYFNDELARKVNDIETKYGNMFLRDTARIRVISNPYYAQFDVSGFQKITPSAISELTTKFENNPTLTNFVNDLSIQNNTECAMFREQICDELNLEAYGVTTRNLQMFDKNGQPINDGEDFFMAAKRGVVFAAPEGRPSLLKPYTYDIKTLSAKPADPKSYKKVMDRIKASMPSKEAEWAEEDKLINQGKASQFIYTYAAYRAESQHIAEEINTIAPEKRAAFKAATLSLLKRKVADHNPAVSYDVWAKTVGLAPEEMFSKATVEARRRLTERAIEGYIDHYMNEYRFTPEVGKLIKGTSVRQFSYFMLKRGEENKAENDRIIREFFEGDAAKKTQMIRDRIKEYQKLKDELYEKEFSDKDIVDNLEKISEFGVGMGMEFIDPILGNINTWGLQFTEEEIAEMKDLNAKAYAVNNSLTYRLEGITSTYYQYGGLEKVDADKMGDYFNVSTDPMFRKTIMTVGPSMAGLFVDRCETLKKFADPTKTREIDYIYDGRSRELPDDETVIGKAAFDTGRLMIFYKDSPQPVILNCSKPNRVPPMMEAVTEITPELAAAVQQARVDHQISAIDKNDAFTPEMKNLEKNIVFQTYEMGVIAATLESHPENRASLRSKMAEYLASLTVRQMAKNMGANMDAESVAKLISDESVKKLSKDLSKTVVVDLVMNKILENPGKFNNLDAESVYKDLVAQFSAVSKQQLEAAENQRKEQRTKEAADSIKTIAGYKTLFSKDNRAINAEKYGLNHAMLRDLASQSKLKGLTIDRSSIQVQAMAILLENGTPIEKIMEDSPEMQRAREKAAALAIKDVLANNAEAVTAHLFAGIQKINAYIQTKLPSFKDFSVAELASPENAPLVPLAPIIKDFFQELNSANANLPDDKKLDPKKLDEVTTLSDFTNMIADLANLEANTLGKLKEQGKDYDPCAQASNSVSLYLRGVLKAAVIKAASQLPENAGKPIEACWNEKTVLAFNAGLMKMARDTNLNNFLAKCQKDRPLAEKVMRSIMDDSLRDGLDFSVEIKGEDVELHMNVPQMYSKTDYKMNVNIHEAVSQFEQMAKNQQEAQKQKAAEQGQKAVSGPSAG